MRRAELDAPDRCLLGRLASLAAESHTSGPGSYLSEQLKAYRSGERVHEVMSITAKGLGDADIADLAAWYASIEVKADVKKK